MLCAMNMRASCKQKMRNLVMQRILDLCKEFPEVEAEVMMCGRLDSLSNVRLLDLYESILCEDE